MNRWRIPCGQTYSPEFKSKVLAYAAAHGVYAASRTFEISIAAIYRWQGRIRPRLKWTWADYARQVQPENDEMDT